MGFKEQDENYIKWLRKTFQERDISDLEVKMLWGKLVKAKVITPDGIDVSSSFRHTGSILASVWGGDYLDYYMADSFIRMLMGTFDMDTKEIEENLMKLAHKDGWVIEPIGN